MSYQEKCEQLYKDCEVMKTALNIINDMKFDIGNSAEYVRDVKAMKAILSTALAATQKEDKEKDSHGQRV